MNKKVAIVTLDYYPAWGGVAVYWKNLFFHLSKEKYLLVAPQLTKTSKKEAAVTRIGFLFKFIWPRWLRLFINLRRIVVAEKIDLVIAAQILPVGTVCWFLKSLGFLTSYQVSLHGMDLAILSGHKKILARLILTAADKIMVNSLLTKELALQSGVKESKIYIIYPCPNIIKTSKQDLKKKYQLTSDNIMISVGRLTPRKGVDNTLRALPTVWAKFPDLYYLIIGEGDYLSHLQFIANNLPQEHKNQVIFTGAIPVDQLGNYYRLTKFFILPTRIINGDLEGFGIVNLEAGLYKKPVIAGKISGLTRSVVADKTGLLVDSEDPSAIARAVVELLGDPARCEYLGSNNFVYAQKFNWAEQAANLVKNT